MPDFDRILEIKKVSQKRLLTIPGVHAVAVGAKIVGGKRTGEVSISVFVTEKRALSDLPTEHQIPATIEGIKTDVIEQERVRRANGLPDLKTYSTLIGGIRIQAGGGLGGGGTLGCIAHTNDTPPRVVGITCHHVVAEPRPLATNVSITDDHNNTLTIAVSGATATTSTLIVIELHFDTAPLNPAAYYTTSDSDTDVSIAGKLKEAIDGLALSGVVVTVTGAQVKIDTGNSKTVDHMIIGPHQGNVKAKLHAAVSNPEIKKHVITFTGESKNGYGIYAEIDPGGGQPSIGGLTAVDEHFALSGVASAVASFLQSVGTKLGVTGITISAPLGAKTVTIEGAEAVTCDISHDTRVGQPDDRFGCSTSWCTNHRIGRVTASRADVDVALILLDAGRKYLAEIQEIGVVKGFYEVTDTDVHPGGPGDPSIQYPVKKRGKETGLTPPPDDGAYISHLHMDGYGDIGDFYQEGMLIISGHDFADHGDSGSAVISAKPGDEGKVVGILYAITPSILHVNNGLATPIKRAMDAMNIVMETATDAQKGVPRTVPKIAGVNMAMFPEDERDAVSMAGRPSNQLRDRLAEVGNEISATPLGRDYAEAVQRHIPEVQDLVNMHRQVGAVWRRNGGNQIVASFLEMVQSPERTLPRAIGDRPITECLMRIQKALLRYGSGNLKSDLARLGPRLMETVGLTYPQILSDLQSATTE